MKKLSLGLLALSLLFSHSLSASETADTPEHRSLVEYIAKKDLPEMVNIDLHMRSSFNVNPNAEGDDNAAYFRFDHLMIDIHGHITDKLSYKYLQRLNKSGQTFRFEKLSNTIDYAYLKYRFHPKASVTAGRQALFFGGFEYDEYPVNIYDYSTIGGHIDCFLTGASVMFNPTPTQEIGVQVVNNRHGSSTEAYGAVPPGMQSTRVPLYYSFAWNGNFRNDNIRLRYAVTSGEQMKGKWILMIGGGQRFLFNKFDIYLDALYHRAAVDHLGAIRSIGIMPDGTAWNGLIRNVEYLSVISEANYRFLPKWNIRAKVFYDRASVYKDYAIFTKGNYLSGWGCQGGIEFYPMKDDNLHLFLNATGKLYKEINGKPLQNPDDSFRLSLGFIYRLPVL